MTIKVVDENATDETDVLYVIPDDISVIARTRVFLMQQWGSVSLRKFSWTLRCYVILVSDKREVNND